MRRESPMSFLRLVLLSCCWLACLGLRAPAVPLVVNNPFFSIWSPADKLTDCFPTFWDGLQTIGMVGMVRVHGVSYRWMGVDTFSGGTPAADQVSLVINPTQTIYSFKVATTGVYFNVTFSTPSLMTPSANSTASLWSTFGDSLSIVTIDVASDTLERDVAFYYHHTAEAAVNAVSEPVTWAANGSTIRIGSAAQKVLGTSGDAVRPSWGWLYTVAPEWSEWSVGASWKDCAEAFLSGRPLPATAAGPPRPANQLWPVAAIATTVVTSPQVRSFHFVLAYDLVAAMDYFGTALRPYSAVAAGSVENWLHAGASAAASLTASCRQADVATKARLAEAFPYRSDYVDYASLVYRQVLGGAQHTSVPAGAPAPRGRWLFVKEMSSAGDISTVDVLFPMAPLLLAIDPTALLEAMIPVLEYALNHTNVAYNLPWAPHHLGTWPIADLPPGKQEQMPMEESGNLIIMAAAVFDRVDTATRAAILHYAPLLLSYAQYINSTLPHPPKQLCTDDFTGPSPNNTNLAAKGIIALAAYDHLVDTPVFAADIRRWTAVWIKEAYNADPKPHYLRQFGLTGSYSLKYNILWQYLVALETKPFPDDVLRNDLEFYSLHAGKYGYVLDERHRFTLAEYMGCMMGACKALAPSVCTAISDMFGSFVDDTSPRLPLTDWYDVDDAKRISFEARATMGDIFTPLLLAAAK